MSESAISIVGLSKAFLRFRHPGWRALGALGLPVPSSRYDVFSALKDVNIEIKRGEKVALIGRNGAGKSTLLRLVSGQMRPDTGCVRVNGQVQALLELGTGFHPDFTGVENIRSALAYQGMPQRQVNACIDEIADFTELDEFLTRPVKEYSSGMYARLAFAVATSITPEVLIIDEVLGAGDAYFMGKCIQRMKALTGQGATILFVSHDMGSVQLLCDRGIWLDHGRVREDGDLLPVSKAYLASVREEEEARIKAKSMSLTKRQATTLLASSGRTTLLRLVGVDGVPPQEPFALASVRLGDGLGMVGEIRPDERDNSAGAVIVDPEFMNWTSNTQIDNVPCWLFGDFGGRYLHAPIQANWTRDTRGERWVEIEYRGSPTSSVLLEQFQSDSGSYETLARIPSGSATDGWQHIRVSLREDKTLEDSAQALLSELAELAPDDRYGSGEIRLSGFGFFDEDNRQRHTLVTGAPAFALLSYRAVRPVSGAVPVIAVYRPDGTCAMQVIATLAGASFSELEGEGGIRVDFNPLYLGPGDYLVSVALFKELNQASAIEPAAYDLHDRCYALKVLPPLGVHVEIGTVNQPTAWALVR